MKPRNLVASLVTALIVTVLVAGCAYVKQDWETARAHDTILAYQEFLREHPGSQYQANAEARMSLLREQEAKRQQAEEAAARVRREAELAQEKVAQEIERLANDASPDSVKKLIGMLEAQLSKVQGRGEFTTGFFEGGMVGLGAITNEGAMRLSLVEALGRTRNKWATPVLILALKDPERSILTMSRDGNTYFYRVREAAAGALRAVTGQDFGDDAARWQDWWQKNKS